MQQFLPKGYPRQFQKICGPRLSFSLAPFHAFCKEKKKAELESHAHKSSDGEQWKCKFCSLNFAAIVC
jgi:hypothetical protein